MALTITGSDIGYDTTGIGQLEHKIHTEVIDKACGDLDNAYSNFQTKLEDIWQGKSAQNFVQNMGKDIKTIKDALEATHKALTAELTNINKAMAQIDQDLVKTY